MLKNDITGNRYGKLVVKMYLGRKHHSSYWRCLCDCGKEVDCYYGNLVRGTTTSCGCMRSEYAKMSRNCHGESTSRLYKEWSSMRNRCFNKNSRNYRLYGGRGIKVCDEWSAFWPFRNWAYSNGYADNLSIDRIDPNGDYSPSNCRWIPMEKQAGNKRTNVFIEYNGEKKTIAEWSRVLGISRAMLQYRVKAGWTPEQCIETPKNERKA